MAKDLKNYVMEALKLQPLSEEEKSKRKILGRLFGPIATTTEGTRNGRKYNKVLWEKALNDDIFKEKLANKCLFLELGHPADREEIDMTKVCACIPEPPQIIDGDLYAYVDILDTPNGKILKTLCDYGFVPGISSRGSGDVMANDEVDPETFFLETFDIVGIPAVKKARLQMCESLNKNKSLSQALTESYKKASTEEQVIMKEALNNLAINLNEGIEEEDCYPGGTPKDIELIPDAVFAEELVETAEPLDSESEEAEAAEEVDEVSDETVEVPEKDAVEVEDTEVKDEVESEDAAGTTEAEFTVTEDRDVCIGDLTTVLLNVADFDTDTPVDMDPLVIDGKEYALDGIYAHRKDDKVMLSVLLAEQSDIDDEKVETEEAEDEAEEEPVETEEAVSDAEVEVLESLKEAIRLKDQAQKEAQMLRQKSAVSDAKVKTLTEQLNSYKATITKISAEAETAKKSEKNVQTLTEQLNTTTEKLNDATAKLVDFKAKAKKALQESAENAQAQVESLKEELAKSQQELDATTNSLNEQINTYKQKAASGIKLAKQYKAQCQEAMSEYINFRASMLGVRASDITSQLNESFTVADINTVCDKILNESVPTTKLPFNVNVGSKVKINESKARTAQRSNPEEGYAIDDSLLELAGLK